MFLDARGCMSSITSCVMNTSLIFSALWFLHLEKKATDFVFFPHKETSKKLCMWEVIQGNSIKEVGEWALKRKQGRGSQQGVFDQATSHKELSAQNIMCLRGGPHGMSLLGYLNTISSGPGWGLLSGHWYVPPQGILACCYGQAGQAQALENIGKSIKVRQHIPWCKSMRQGLSRLAWWLIQLSNYVFWGVGR